jgi:hypothetical protein
MTQALSQRLGPRAKRIALRGPASLRVSGLVEVGACVRREAFERAIHQLGGTIRSWPEGQRVTTVEIDAGQLSALADLTGVMYVEAGETCRLPEPAPMT